MKTAFLLLTVVALLAQVGKKPPPPARTYSGIIRSMDAKSFDLEAKDTRILTIEIPENVAKPAGLKPGASVDVQATLDPEGVFHAVTIRVNAEVAQKADTGDQVEAEAVISPPPTILVRPGPLYDEGDSGPPKLKRGIPAPSPKRKEEARVAAPAEIPPVAARAEIPPAPSAEIQPAAAVNTKLALIAKARSVAATFMAGLPNYVCQEIATRHFSETRPPSWRVVDVVSAELVFEDGKESYRNLAINGKASKKAPEETGAWSSGEFGTILASIFGTTSDAGFQYAQSDTIARLPASVYTFAVPRPRSNWKIQVAGQHILPAYNGSIWIDKQSGNVLRIEMQAREIPEEFPSISTETSVDYEFISLGTPEKFLLPVRAEVLSCSRGSNDCQRNVIEFRNYRKFTGQSTIKFNQ